MQFFNQNFEKISLTLCDVCARVHDVIACSSVTYAERVVSDKIGRGMEAIKSGVGQRVRC